MSDDQINYKKDVSLDKSRLDMECLGQSRLTLKYTGHQTQMEYERDLAKEKLELVKSELLTEIYKAKPVDYGLEKFTEKIVDALITQNQRYKDAMNAYLAAKSEYGYAKGAVEAVSDRKSMIESLVKLHGQNYFAEPNFSSGSNDDGPIFKEVIRAAGNEKIANVLNRRKANELKLEENQAQPIPVKMNRTK